MNKLPTVDISFWVMLITATTLGETAGDLLSMTMNFGYATSSIILVTLFLLALVFELIVKTRHDALYWTVIVLTSTAGTTLSDYIDRSLGLGYALGTTILMGLLAAVFTLWKISAHSFSISKINSLKTEALYWTAILLSSTLGTALGDFLSDDSGLGFGGSTLTLACILLIILALTIFTKTSRVLLFWLAIIIIHPIGATLGDYFTKPEGLHFGPSSATAMLLILFSLVATLTRIIKKPALTND